MSSPDAQLHTPPPRARRGSAALQGVVPRLSSGASPARAPGGTLPRGCGISLAVARGSERGLIKTIRVLGSHVPQSVFHAALAPRVTPGENVGTRTRQPARRSCTYKCEMCTSVLAPTRTPAAKVLLLLLLLFPPSSNVKIIFFKLKTMVEGCRRTSSLVPGVAVLPTPERSLRLLPAPRRGPRSDGCYSVEVPPVRE